MRCVSSEDKHVESNSGVSVYAAKKWKKGSLKAYIPKVTFLFHSKTKAYRFGVKDAEFLYMGELLG